MDLVAISVLSCDDCLFASPNPYARAHTPSHPRAPASSLSHRDPPLPPRALRPLVAPPQLALARPPAAPCSWPRLPAPKRTRARAPSACCCPGAAASFPASRLDCAPFPSCYLAPARARIRARPLPDLAVPWLPSTAASRACRRPLLPAPSGVAPVLASASRRSSTPAAALLIPCCPAVASPLPRRCRAGVFPLAVAPTGCVQFGRPHPHVPAPTRARVPAKAPRAYDRGPRP
nr:vegetative cell wall protein gp1-like [Aegilops tauschii subsp. strangulata]